MMMVEEREADLAISSRQAYADLTVEWVRLTHTYARSVRAYLGRTRTPRVRLAPRQLHAPAAEWAPAPAYDPVAVRSVTATPRPPAAPSPLTARQSEVAQLIARGLSNEEIARQLVLSPGTVGNHVGHILRRLGARNRAQIAAWVTQRAGRGGSGGELAS